MTNYKTVHALCVNPDLVVAGPGDLIIAASEPMAMVGFEPDHLGLLSTGAPLFVEAATSSLRAAIQCHCFGLGAPSTFRAALAERMGLKMITRQDQRAGDREINAWIARYTWIRLRPHPPGLTFDETRLGWLNPPIEGVNDAPGGQGGQ